MANEHSNIVPDMKPTAKVADFKFWCQKVLPLVYDDSLSYYEVLNKLVVFLNQVIDNINADIDNVAELKDDFLLLQEYVNNFFDDIDQLVTYAERAEAAQNAAAGAALSAAGSATNAAGSATSAATSATNAASSSLNAMDARDAAIAAKTAAEIALSNAQTAANSAEASATAASNSALSASGSATNAAASASSAEQSFNLADAARVAAQTAETNAESSATDAAASAEEAETAAASADGAKAQAMIANADNITATDSHDIGDYFIINGVLYQATADIQIGDTISTETNCRIAVLGNDVAKQSKYVNEVIEISSVNIFDEKYPTVGLVKSDGTININASYGTSDFIPVDSSNENLYFLRSASPFVLYLCYYSDNKESTFVGSRETVFSTSTTALRMTVTIPQTAKYFRISKPNTPDSTMCISYSMVSQYLPYNPVAKIKDTAIDVDKKTSSWYENNFNEKENLLKNASYNLASTVGYLVYDNVKDNAVGYKVVSSDGSTTDIRFTLPEAINLIGVQAFDLQLYIENVNNIASIELSTFTPSLTTYSKTISGSQLLNGWNYIRINTAQQETLTDQTWSTASVFRFVAQGTGAFAITISAINIERMEKAKLIFVDDHGYHDFMTLAYPLLKAAGQPITWALNPGRLGTTVGSYCSILTQSDIDTLANDSYSEFSFHSWNATATASMTAEQIREDIQKCLTYLKKNGICPNHVWRAAWVQNLATNWYVAQDMVEACATYTASASSILWPFINFYNIPRLSIHGRSSSQIDSFFEAMKLTHASYVLYTHGCVEEQYEGNTLHATVAEITYIANKIATGVSEGWLEPTTFNRLMTMKEHDMYTLKA